MADMGNAPNVGTGFFGTYLNSFSNDVRQLFLRFPYYLAKFDIFMGYRNVVSKKAQQMVLYGFQFVIAGYIQYAFHAASGSEVTNEIVIALYALFLSQGAFNAMLNIIGNGGCRFVL